ncbi:MAG: thiamine pyrophosphate-binding protein [Parvularculaceae bacterium]
MLRQATFNLINGGLSRREFLALTKAAGVGAAAAAQLAGVAEGAKPAVEGTIRLKDATGGRVTCETLKEWGVTHVFGNTGAYEAGFVDALVDYPGIQYVLGLQEGAVMAMADGYARVTGETAFVNVHSITGTANALGLIVNAWADNSPVVISVGFNATRHDNLGVFTETAKVENVAEPFTKLSFRAARPENLAESLRRALRLAATTPPGPVFLGVPADVWSGVISRAEIIPSERSAPPTKLYPDEAAVAKAADWLATARNPLLVSGAELPRWGGLRELVAISDRLGAAVSGDTASSRSSMAFPSDHPRYLGALRGRIEPETPFDVVLLAGASRLSLARGGHPLIPRDARIIEIGVREEHLSRNYPSDLLIYADATETLAGIAKNLAARVIDPARVAARAQEAAKLKDRRQAELKTALARVRDETPIAPERLAAEIDRAIDPAAIVVTEGVSSDAHIWNYVKFDQVDGGRRHLISSGGSLGWGVGAGVGAKLGAPDSPVVVLVGDGGFQFGLQALWTAKRFETGMIVVIFNNRAYQANRWAISGLKGRGVKTGQFIGVNIDDPDIDHVAMARGYGHDGERVERPEDIASAFERARQAEKDGEVYVLDVIVARRGPGAESDWHE